MRKNILGRGFWPCYRSRWLAPCLLAMLALVLSVRATNAAERLTADTVKAGLRTTTVEEDGYVDRILALVNQGTIPYSMLEGTFQWARRKSHHKFQYFKHAMDLRIARNE